MLMRRGVTQREIAERLGVAQSTVSAYYMGVRGVKRGVPFDVMTRLLDMASEHAGESVSQPPKSGRSKAESVAA
jgi:predicted transcriptional regulator